MNKRSVAICAAAVVVVLAVVFVFRNGPAERPTTQPNALIPVQLRIGYVATLEGLPVYVAVDDGLFQSAGFLGAGLTKYTTSDLCTQALVDGEVDLAFTGAAQAMIAGAKNPGKLRLLSLTCSQMAIVVRAQDTTIHTAQDLNGPVGVFPGSIFEKLVLRTFKAIGGDPSKLDPKKIPPGAQPAAIGDGSVHAIWTLEPYGTLAVREKDGRLVTKEDLFAKYLLGSDGYPGAAIVISMSLVQRFPDAEKRIAAAIRQADDHVHASGFDPTPYLARHIDIAPERIRGLLPAQALIDDQIPRKLYFAMADLLKDLGELPSSWAPEELLR